MEPISTTVLTALVLVRLGRMIVPKHIPNSCVKCGHDNAESSDYCQKCGAGMRPHNNAAVAERIAFEHARHVAEGKEAKLRLEKQREKDRKNLDKRIAKNVLRKRKALEGIVWCGSCQQEKGRGSSFCDKCGAKLSGLPLIELEKRLKAYQDSFWAKL